MAAPRLFPIAPVWGSRKHGLDRRTPVSTRSGKHGSMRPPPHLQSGGELGVALSHSPERHQAEPRRLPFRGPGQGTGEPGRPAQGVGGQRLLRRVWLTSSLQGTVRSRMITQLCELAWTPGAVRRPRRVGRGGRQAAPGPGSYFLAPLPEHRPLTAQGEGAVAGDRADHCRPSSRQTFL